MAVTDEFSPDDDNAKWESKQSCVASLKALRQAVVCANNLLCGDDLEFITTTSPDIKEASQDIAKRVAAIITGVVTRYGVGGTSSDLDSVDSGSRLSLTPVDLIHDEVTETIDEALEQFNSSLDAARGIQNAVVAPTEGLESELKVDARKGKHSKRTLAYLDIEKPQIHFPDYPIDNSDTPFIPPHALSSTKRADGGKENSEPADGTKVGLYLQDLLRANLEPTAGGTVGTKHPYEDEIKTATEETSQRPFNEDETTVYGSLESTPCNFVTTEEELFDVAERLKRAAEIAIDIENHSVRSFQGFTCLIQISTRREDVLIDALALRGSIHRALAPVFTDESTVKVLHGADRDVQWLERDFGIYIVNMFDTGQAARLLKYPSAGLAYLQARFCSVTGVDKKKFQMADWRQRPLPKDMFQYARSDTHYLLYIYDRLRTELAKKDLVPKAWEQSSLIARKRYAKVRFNPGMARHLAARFSLGFDRHQTLLLEELCRWRDRTAREEDESLHYVAPLNTLFDIVRAKAKARSVEGLMKFGFPSKFVPPLLKERADVIVQLVCDSLDAKLDGNGEKPEQTHDSGFVDKKRKRNVEGQSEFKVMKDPEPQGQAEMKAVQEAREEASVEQVKVAHAPVPPRFPQIRQARKSRQSALFDLDSSSSSESESELAPYRKLLSPAQKTSETARGTQTTGRGKNLAPDEGHDTGHAEKSDLMTVSRRENHTASDPAKSSTSAGVPIDECKSARCHPGDEQDGLRALRTTKSAFDLSDSEETDAGDNERAGIIAKIQEGMTQLGPTTPAQFTVETDVVNESRKSAGKGLDEEAAEVNNVNTFKRSRIDDDGDEGEIVSLQEKYGNKGSGKKRKKRKKNKQKVEIADPVPAFDYSKVLNGKEKTERESFDPMQELRNWRDSRGKKQKRRRKTTPGSGIRSMSFRGGK